MANIGRILGGIQTLVSGVLILFNGCAGIFASDGADFTYRIHISATVTILCSILILMGGALLCAEKGAGGILALIGGGFFLIGCFIPIYSYYITLTGPLHVSLLFGYNFWFIDPLLAISGGIVGLVFRNKAYY
jgi:hypothetical protein